MVLPLDGARVVSLGVSISGMFDCMTSMLGYFPFRHFYEGYVPQRVGMGHHLLAPYGAYPA